MALSVYGVSRSTARMAFVAGGSSDHEQLIERAWPEGGILEPTHQNGCYVESAERSMPHSTRDEVPNNEKLLSQKRECRREAKANFAASMSALAIFHSWTPNSRVSDSRKEWAVQTAINRKNKFLT